MAERRRRLADLLGRERYLPVSTVAEKLGVSEATARRDLAVLDESGRLTRTFGGAMANGPSRATIGEYNQRFASFADRAAHMAAEKRKIAKKVAGLIKPGMSIFLDAGTTVDALALHLAELPDKKVKGVTVVTHSLAVADRLASSEAIEVHLLGGQLLGRQMIVIGDVTRRGLYAHDIELAILGAEALNHGGAFNSQADVAALQRQASMRAKQTVLMLDSSKLGETAPTRLMRPDEIDLLATDASAASLRRYETGIDEDRLL